MAITVADDFTTIFDCNSLNAGRFNIAPVNNSNTVDTAIFAQSTGSLRARVTGTGVGGNGFDLGSNTDIQNEHIMVWARSLDAVSSAGDGWRIRISSSASGATNFGDISVADLDSVRNTFKGFYNFCCDPKKPFVAVTGIPPLPSAIRSIAILADHISASSRDTFFWDEMKRGTGITVTGGASVPRGSIEIGSDDATNGRGTFIDIAGVFYVMGRITIGDVTAATNSTFEDINKTWVFQNMLNAISPTFNKIELVGGTGTNRCTFGISSGTGNAKEGSGGNTFLGTGEIPFRVECIDSEIISEFFGCNFINPSTIRKSHVHDFKMEDNSLTTFVDDTLDANDAGANDVALYPATPALNDANYYGMNERFSNLELNVGIAKFGIYTIIWEYSRSGGWSALTDVTDGTNGFKLNGTNTLTFAIPDDWIATAVNGDTRYWIRARISAFTFSTVVPTLTQVTAEIGGGVRIEHTNAEFIRDTFVNMDTIRVRNSGKLKKCVITDSVASAKNGALDLGLADPATDTVRDLTIQNCSKGILLKGTSIGTTTYNFRNIKFSNNTNDVRVDFPSTATIVINILEGGDTPTIDNVNSSIVTINNSVPVDVKCVDKSGVGILDVSVWIDDTGETNPSLFEGQTNSTGVFSATHNGATPLNVIVKARKRGYQKVRLPATIVAGSGLDLTIGMSESAGEDFA